jgi:hypothetical protein
VEGCLRQRRGTLEPGKVFIGLSTTLTAVKLGEEVCQESSVFSMWGYICRYSPPMCQYDTGGPYFPAESGGEAQLYKKATGLRLIMLAQLVSIK